MTVVNQPTLSVALLLLISLTGAAGIDPYLVKPIASLTKLTKFFTYYFNPNEEVVPDLLFGIVLGLGHVRVLIRHLEEGVCTVNVTATEKDYLLVNTLYDIELKMSIIFKQTRGKVTKKKDKYSNALVDRMLDPNFWTIDQPLQEDSLIKPSYTPNGTLCPDEMAILLNTGLPDEEMSDYCLSEIFGIRSPRCYVSPRCKAVLIGGGPSSGYPLTHRLFYVQTARQANCHTLGPPQLVEAYIKYFCSSILAEAERIATLNFPSMMIDLFVEQVALCGAEGFMEFVRKDWIEEIISWQRPEGCFGTGVERESEEHESATTKSTTTSPRHKREDSEMEYDCLMHFTGVATAAIAASLRSMVECTDYDITTRQTDIH